jgi:hypothetical protein
MYKWVVGTLNPDLDHPQYSLHRDDIAWATYLYQGQVANSNINTQFCTIKGRIYDIEGRGFQGAQLTASELDDGLRYAITAISGSKYTVCVEDNETAGREAGEFVIMGLRPNKAYKLEYGPIPDWCDGQSPCGLGSGINPFAPPRQLNDGTARTADGNSTFFCEEGGEVIETEQIVASADLEDDITHFDDDENEFKCTLGVGKEIVVPKGEEGDGGDGIKKKGWCSLVPESQQSFGFLWLILSLLMVLRFRRYLKANI